MLPSPWHWDLHPTIVLSLFALVAFVVRGHRPARHRTHARDAALVSGFVVLAVALVTPLAGATHSLFWAHMLQHMLLTYVAPLLLVVGYATRDVTRALHRSLGPHRASLRPVRRVWRRHRGWLATPWFATTMFNGVLWLWHLPVAYDAAVDNDVIHVAEHVTLFLTAWWFWSTVVGPRSHAPASALLAVFVTAMSTGALGSLLVFARTQWYPAYHGAAGIAALTDQQLGGVIMNAIALPVQLGVIAVLFGRWMAAEERRATQLDRALTLTRS